MLHILKGFLNTENEINRVGCKSLSTYIAAMLCPDGLKSSLRVKSFIKYSPAIRNGQAGTKQILCQIWFLTTGATTHHATTSTPPARHPSCPHC